MRYIVDENGCWNWDGPKSRGGYGKITLHDRTELAHRLIAHVIIRPIRPTEVVAHQCDNPACINPAHLFITSHAGNIADRDAKGRQTKGWKVVHRKLTDEQVLAIREEYANAKGTMGQIGARYGVTAGAVLQIIHRRTFKWL